MTGEIWPGFLLLAVPGAVSMLLLAQLRFRVPSVADPAPDEDAPRPAVRPAGRRPSRLWGALVGRDLPRVFYVFSLAAALTTAGLMTFGVISYRLVGEGLVSVAVVPVVYALAMAAGAVAALVTGDLFDRWGARVLLLVPVLVVAVQLWVFSDRLAAALVGVAVWGAAGGIQDSTVKAYVADLVAAPRRATAFGVFAAVQGVGALVGGTLAGALVEHHRHALLIVVTLMQVGAGVLVVATSRGRTPS